jgi:transcriptional regulator with XRE-family HTH domain
VGFAERLKEAMKRKGVGVGEFAAQVPVEPNSVSRWRAGYVPGPVHLARVAQLLDVSTGFLKEGQGSDDPEAWPAGMELGHREKSDPSQASGLSPYSSGDSFSPPDTPADRPTIDPFQGLDEPVLSRNKASEWTNFDILYRVFRSEIQRLAKEHPDLMGMWIDLALMLVRLGKAEDMDRAQDAPQSNGHTA